MNTSSVEVTAGLGGFLVLFALALAVWFLGRDLTRRLRRMNRAEEDRRAVAAPADDATADDVAVGDGEPGDEPADRVPPRTDA